MTVVIPIEADTAHMYLHRLNWDDYCEACDDSMIALVHECPHSGPEREWVGVDTLPEVPYSPLTQGGVRSLEVGDDVVLAEPCPTCKGYTGVLCGFSTCHDGRLLMVSARVAEVLPVYFAQHEDSARTHYTRSILVDMDGKAHIGDDWGGWEPLPGDWSGKSWAIRLADPKEQP